MSTASTIFIILICVVVAIIFVLWLINSSTKKRQFVAASEELAKKINPDDKKICFYQVTSVEFKDANNFQEARVNLSKINKNISSNKKHNIYFNINKEIIEQLQLSAGKKFRIKKGLVRFF